MALSQWAKIARNNEERMRLIAQESYVVTASKVIVKSPVDTGLFRNNWFSALNKPSTKTTASKSKKAHGEKGGSRFQEFIEKSSEFKIGDRLFLTNSLHYAENLEMGSSKQAPLGMVRLAAAQWPVTVAKIAKKIR